MEINKKHAYLIIAHNNFEQLKKLIELLDYEENDIYIHLDKKSKLNIEELKKAIKKSKITFTERIKVSWGDYSLVEAELILLKASVKENYMYYHLISGADLPIKSMKEIHEFFEKNNGKQFVHFRREDDYDGIEDRLRYYYFFTNFRVSKGIEKVIKYAVFKTTLIIQKLLKINRLKNNKMIIKSGSQWFSITNELAKYLVEKEEKISKMYKHTFCSDEVFLQTIVYNNEKFINELYYSKYDDNYIASMRYILWKNKRPHTWKLDDYEELVNSNYLFARKFNEKEDNYIIDKIYEKLKSKN